MMSEPSTALLTVSGLNRKTRQLLEQHFAYVRVEGEISNLARPSSGHWYFSLKDAQAQIRCAFFRNRAQWVSFKPQEGDQVIVTARVSLFEPRGEYQLICEHLQPGGEGQLQKAFEQLKGELAARGWFDAARKRPLPSRPACIGVVTSPSGAAIHDILTVLARRFPATRVNLYPSVVQGQDAAEQLVKAIAFANRHADCDVLIVGRGGGSLEDLWPFNEERVAAAIIASTIPIVSAVGHETDTTISDLVADYRAATPSAAAEVLSIDQHVVLQAVQQARQRLQLLMSRRLQQDTQALARLRKRVKHPQEMLQAQYQQLDRWEMRMQRLMQQYLKVRQQHYQSLLKRLSQQRLEKQLQQKDIQVRQRQHRLYQGTERILQQQRERLHYAAGRLNSVSPLASLERGYSLAYTSEHQLLRSVNQVHKGDKLALQLAEGRLYCEVLEKHMIEEKT